MAHQSHPMYEATSILEDTLAESCRTDGPGTSLEDIPLGSNMCAKTREIFEGPLKNWSSNILEDSSSKPDEIVKDRAALQQIPLEIKVRMRYCPCLPM